MKNILKKAIAQFEKDGRYIEIHLEDVLTTLISYNHKELETFSYNQTTMGNMRIYENGRWVFFSFNGNNPLHLVKELEQMMTLLSFAPFKEGKLLSSQKVTDFIKVPTVINPQDLSLTDKNDVIRNYHQIMLKEGSSFLSSSRAVYKDSLKKSYFFNSEGSEIEQEKQFVGIALYAIARDGSEIQQNGVSHAAYGGLEVIQGLENQVIEATHGAIDLIKAPPLEKGKYSVILDNRMTGVFAHEAFGHLSEADFIYDNDSLKQMMPLNRTMGVQELNIIDDGTMETLAGYTPYDDEGVKAQKNYLIKDGELSGRLHSRETAFIMGETLTGNARSLTALHSPLVRMTNTFIDKGSYHKNDLFSMVENGIYCVNYIGGMTNLEQFTFTPARTYRIKNGKIGELCKNVMLSGNTFETLHNIKAIANDVKHFGTLGGCGKGGQNGLAVTIGGPHILLENTLIG